MKGGGELLSDFFKGDKISKHNNQELKEKASAPLECSVKQVSFEHARYIQRKLMCLSIVLCRLLSHYFLL